VQDPCTHNLWPFEAGIAIFVGIAGALPGAIAGALIVWVRGHHRNGAKDMSRIEEAMLRRLSGVQITLWSIGLGLLRYLPLRLYIWFGPEDGNPIGLGLLAVAVLPFAGVGVVVGLIKTAVEYFRDGSR
jgi:hypothetical protein